MPFSLPYSPYSLRSTRENYTCDPEAIGRHTKGERVGFRHVVAVSQFSRNDLEQIFTHADAMRDLPRNEQRLSGRILATIFYEPSTRTRLSFESAMLRLGGGVISTENAREFSSAIKGETVEDTIRIVESYADAIVIRHYEQGAANRAAKVSAVPILNAGDGPGNTPPRRCSIFTPFVMSLAGSTASRLRWSAILNMAGPRDRWHSCSAKPPARS